MAFINFNGKNSSRILQPPGGHSDIFGLKETQHKLETKPLSNANKSGEDKQQNNESTETGKLANPDENMKKSEEKEKGKSTTVVPQRVRVPPGGFSSKLW